MCPGFIQCIFKVMETDFIEMPGVPNVFPSQSSEPAQWEGVSWPFSHSLGAAALEHSHPTVPEVPSTGRRQSRGLGSRNLQCSWNGRAGAVG